jgi:uncharacterized coiled-coil protein SlyX
MSDQMTIEALDQHIEELEKDNARLSNIITQLEMGTFELGDVSSKGNEVNAEFSGGACHLIIDAFTQHFIQTGASNFVLMGFDDPETKERYEVTIQRVEGEYVSDQLRRLTRELSEAKEKLKTANL